MCECLTPAEELTIDTLETYNCLSCRDIGQEDMVGILKEKAAQNLGMEDTLRLDIVELGIECDKLKAINSCEMGPREKLLNKKLEDIKVVRQAYHGNVFVGNHCKLVLKNYESLCSVIADKPGAYQKVVDIFRIFSNICPFLFLKSRFLTEDEVMKVSELCREFGNVYPVLFPDNNITRKIHELIFNVPTFISRFRTVGRLSEEEGESLHASVNCELQQLFTVRDPTQKLALLLKRQELRCKAPKTFLQRKPRLCLVCKQNGKPRVFLRGGNDGKRHCPKCNPDKF